MNFKSILIEVRDAWPIAIAVIGSIIYVVWAFRNDKGLWRNKPKKVLEDMITEGDLAMELALRELKRRGEDIQPYAPLVLRFLISDSRMKRVAGKIAVRKFYPEIARELGDYEGSASIEICREKASNVIQKFGVADSLNSLNDK